MSLKKIYKILDKASRTMICPYPDCRYVWTAHKVHRNIKNPPAKCPKCNRALR